MRNVAGITIRELGASDAEAWWQLRFISLEEAPLAFGKALAEHRASTVSEAAGRLGDPASGSFLLGAFDADRLAGLVRFAREPGSNEHHKGSVYGMYVAAEHRRRGIARALLESLVERAGTQPGLEHILLSVGSGQEAAIALYRGLGFERYATEPRALKVGGTYVDEDLMILRLPRPPR